MATDPAIAHLLHTTDVNCWIGPQRHFIGYSICQGELYNLVMSHPGMVKNTDKFGEQGHIDEMKQEYKDYHPTVRRVLQHVENCLHWQLSELPSLKSWSSVSGRVVVIGDAAHAMLPFLAQVLRLLKPPLFFFFGQTRGRGSGSREGGLRGLLTFGSGSSYGHRRWCMSWRMLGKGKVFRGPAQPSPHI